MNNILGAPTHCKKCGKDKYLIEIYFCEKTCKTCNAQMKCMLCVSAELKDNLKRVKNIVKKFNNLNQNQAYTYDIPNQQYENRACALPSYNLETLPYDISNQQYENSFSNFSEQINLSSLLDDKCNHEVTERNEREELICLDCGQVLGILFVQDSCNGIENDDNKSSSSSDHDNSSNIDKIERKRERKQNKLINSLANMNQRSYEQGMEDQNQINFKTIGKEYERGRVDQEEESKEKKNFKQNLKKMLNDKDSVAKALFEYCYNITEPSQLDSKDMNNKTKNLDHIIPYDFIKKYNAEKIIIGSPFNLMLVSENFNKKKSNKLCKEQLEYVIDILANFVENEFIVKKNDKKTYLDYVNYIQELLNSKNPNLKWFENHRFADETKTFRKKLIYNRNI